MVERQVLILPLQKRAFDERYSALRQYVAGSSYGRQKESFKMDFVRFLEERSSGPSAAATASSLETATPTDVIRFLFYRDQRGRTTIHAFDCPNIGKPGLFDCACPVRLAAGTVDSYIGMLRAIFNANGRRGADNPCDSAEVKGWLKACELEQRRHRVPVKQAQPVFSTHLRLVVSEIQLRLARLPPMEPFFPERFLLYRDWAFFTIQWFCGDRAGDLGNTLGREVVRLEDGSLLFNHTVGKTIREAGGQLLVVPRVPSEPSLCPVSAFDRYVSACKRESVDLTKGYLFPPTASPLHRSIRDAPLMSKVTTKRLRVYLPDNNFTAHGARAGCAITLFMLGATKENVMEHCRWATEQICRHYTRIEKVKRLDSSAGILRAGVSVSGGISEADSAAFLYDILNSGIDQTPAI